MVHKKSSDSSDRIPETPAPFRSQLGPVSLLSLLFLINFISRIIFSPLLPTIERELTISHGQAGFLFFLITAGYLVGLLLSGLLASRATHRATIVISICGVGIALFGIAAAPSAGPIRVGLIALGFAAGLYIPSAIATITSLVDRPHWGKAIAIHELAPNLAFFLSPFVAELFLKWSSWRAALGTLGALALIAGIGFGRFGRGGALHGEAPSVKAFGALARIPAFWLMVALFGLGVSSTIGVYAMLPLYLVAERGLEPGWANTIVALSRSHGPILGLFGGWLSDRLGVKETLVISLVFTGAVTLLLGPAGNSWLSVVVFFQPLLAVCFFPAAFAAVALITPPNARNLAVSFSVPVGFAIGGGAIPSFIGAMGDAGSFAGGFTWTGAAIAAGGVLALFVKMPRGSGLVS
jgi:NNP family nitrate/nitrite transporter-like MFS transporter